MYKNMELYRLLGIAYRKLKGAVYYDKTQSILAREISIFESSDIFSKENPFEELADKLADSIDEEWNAYVDTLLGKLNVLVFPKKLKSYDDNKQIILNDHGSKESLEDVQYFIDLPVEAHLLGVLWIMCIGTFIDDGNGEYSNMYEHSYGNRLRPHLIKDDQFLDSPYLFQPYFSQYENWRNIALEKAKERLSSKQDAMILMLDFKSFFYSVSISETTFNKLLTPAIAKEDNDNVQWLSRLHGFVYEVMGRYSKACKSINKRDTPDISNDRVFLPIGFLPSNILANWYLNDFDEAIVDKINPVYYGRYVDDIVIVDKLEKNSALYGYMHDGKHEQSIADIVSMYFDIDRDDSLLHERIFVETDGKREEIDRASRCNYDPDKIVYEYRVQDVFMNEEPLHNVILQDSKVKFFYFKANATRALLDSYAKQLRANSSEFRFFPDVDLQIKVA